MESNSDGERLKTYLKERTRGGDRHFKSKYIAKDLELSSKEVGALLVKLRASATTVAIDNVVADESDDVARVLRRRPPIFPQTPLDDR